jgi:UDP-N-acetyl-D-glucosamine dehydrogenase
MQQTVAVIGLGYVGLPLAVRAVEQGYAVIGFDTHQEKIAKINKQECPIEDAALDTLLKKFPFEATDQPDRLSKADIVLICVPTPVDEMYYPDLEPVISAATLSASQLKPGVLVVLESTVNPGVSEEVILPIFEKHGHTVGKDFFLAHCPERINPGDEKWNVTNIPRVVGSIDSIGLEKAVAFYRSIVDGEIRPMKSIRGSRGGENCRKFLPRCQYRFCE